MKPLALFNTCLSAALVSPQQTFLVESSVDSNEVFPGFVSFSIEFSSFPDFAGNTTHQNHYSDILLQNLGDMMGSRPYIRVGGNTQDHALYDASLPYALKGTIDPKRSPDYPTTISIGPSYFQSYKTWNDTDFIHGFNFGLGGNSSEGWQTLIDTVPLVCEALGNHLAWWEYGNEPDLYSTSSHGPVRPANWTESIFVDQWLNGTAMITTLFEEHCIDIFSNDSHGYLAPSFGGLNNTLNEYKSWTDSLNKQDNIKLFSTHNYISGASSPGVTLQGTLMNHTKTKLSVSAHVDSYKKIKEHDSSVPPLIFGEANSLYNQGRPGLSNTFGAALWGLDFNLYSASVGFKRVHMHMGTNYRYASWQPVSTTLTTIGTKPPYYGNIAVAAMLGDITIHPPTIVEIPNNDPHQIAYAAYIDAGKTLARIMGINMHTFNSTVDGAGLVPLLEDELPARNSTKFQFNVSSVVKHNKTITLHRLRANGSDAITGITWDGWTYNIDQDAGRPVRMDNVTVGDTVKIGEDGMVSVDVEDSGAVLLDFLEGEGGGEKPKEEDSGEEENRASTVGKGVPGVVVMCVLLVILL